MNFSVDAYQAAQQSQFATLVGLAHTSFGAFEKVVELNLAASKAVLSESFSTLQSLGAAQDPQAFWAIQSGLAQPMTEKAASYSRHLYDIFSVAGSEFSKATEAQTTESQKSATAWVESNLQAAPVGSEAMIALFQESVEAGNNAREAAQKAAAQAVKLVESQLKAA